MCEIRYDFEMIFIYCALRQILSADIIKCGNKLMEMMCVGHIIMWNLKQSLWIEEKKTIANEIRKKARTHKKSRGHSPHSMHHSLFKNYLILQCRIGGEKGWNQIASYTVESILKCSLFNAFVSSCENTSVSTLNSFNF